MNKSISINKCIVCGSEEDLSELDFKGSGEYICEECKVKEV